jgi:hypothetical protein
MIHIPLMLRTYLPSVRGIFIAICLLWNAVSFAQNDSTSSRFKDPEYITSFGNHPHLTFELAKRSQRIDIRVPDKDTFLLRYEPNTKTNFVASFDYRWLSLSLGLFSIHSGDASRKGDTQQFTFGASFNGKRIWNSNFIQVYKGYYISNPSSVDKQWNPATDLYPQRPDISTATFFSNVYYCFNPQRFSYKAALWQLERQEKSAGSFLAGIALRYQLLLSDTSQTLIPPSVESLFKPENRLIGRSISNVNLNAGYVHTFVYRHSWFLTLYLVPGISIQSSAYLAEDRQVRKETNHVAGSSEFRFILGYNGDRWYSGLSSYSISFSSNREMNVRLDSNYNWFRFFVGYRFNAIDRKGLPAWRQRIGL